jgi:(R)-2-hydroxyacyl-CoA dehydratese activating ATPase
VLTLGHDVGTRFVKCCVVADGGLVGSACLQIEERLDGALSRVRRAALAEAGVHRFRIRRSAATGLGAAAAGRSVPVAVPQCLARVARLQVPRPRTVIDVGGLFIHVAALNEEGRLVEGLQSDRCAAGSGRFLETLAEAAGVPFSELSACAAESRTPYVMTSSCAVFAESETISQANQGVDKRDLLAGALIALAHKVASMAQRLGVTPPVALTGGVARLPAFRSALAAALGQELVLLTVDLQLAPAYGAALFAQEARR